MELNWTVLTYFVIALFALSGFFKGWWKEAITTIFLVVLVVLLQMPGVAQILIELVNLIFVTIAGLLPDSINADLIDFLEINLGISAVNGAVQIDAGDGGTWLIILLLLVGVSIVISRFSMPSWYRLNVPYTRYDVTWAGSVLGGLIGGLNGMLIISLVKEYLDGHNLPGGSRLSTEMASAGGHTASALSRGASIQAIEVPTLTILDSFLPWFFIAIAVLLLLVAIKSRIGLLKDKEGFRKVDYKAPLGYEKITWTVKDG